MHDKAIISKPQKQKINRKQEVLLWRSELRFNFEREPADIDSILTIQYV